MRVPILKQHDFLIASIQSALSDDDLLQRGIGDPGGPVSFPGTIIDVTAFDGGSFAVHPEGHCAYKIVCVGRKR
jgi:hypothetical protein